MRRSIGEMVPGLSNSVDFLSVDNLLAMARRSQSNHQNTLRRSFQSRIGTVNLVDYQNLEPRQLLATIQWAAGTFASDEAGVVTTAPTLIVNGTLTTNATVNLTQSGGTATGAGSDFTLSSDITILAGTYSAAPFNLLTGGELVVNGDSLLEGDENIQITMSESHDELTVVDSPVADHTIFDTDEATIELTADTNSLTEGSTDATLTVTLASPTGATLENELTVDLATVDGLTLPADYTLSDTSVTFPIGSGTTSTTDDFEGGATGWSNTTTASDPYFTQFLGQWAAGAPEVSKTFAVASTASGVTLEFDFYEIDSWDGEQFQVYVDDVLIIAETFQQGVNDPGVMGTVGDVSFTVTPTTDGLSNLGFIPSTDQVHHVTMTIANPGSSVKLAFASTLDQAISDESWGVDNISFVAPASTKTVTLTPANDSLLEGDQGVNISIDLTNDDLDGQVTVAGTSQNINIVDNDSATWDVSQNISAVTEGSTVNYTISLTGSATPTEAVIEAGETVSVELSINNVGTASTDYGAFVTSVNDAISMYNGVSMAGNPNTFEFDGTVLTFYGDDTTPADLTFILDAVDDNLVEGDEDHTVDLANDESSSGADITLGTTQVTTTIDDNDTGKWSISQANTTVAEGDSAEFTLSLENRILEGETATIDIGWTLLGETTLSDYAESLSDAVTDAVDAYSFSELVSWDPMTGKLTFTGGDDGSGGSSMTDLIINIDTFDDDGTAQSGHVANLVEPDEAFDFFISNPGGTAFSVDTDGPTTLNTLIEDNETAVVSISTFQDADEDSVTNGIFTVTLSNPSQTETIVNFTDGGVSMGTAQPSFDYAGLSGNTLNFSPEELTKFITINPIDDDLVEGPETVTMRLTSFAARDPDITIAANPADRTSIMISDNDKATWSLTGETAVTEAALAKASYTLSLDGKFQAGEKANVNLSISFPGAGPSMDAGDAADFANGLLADINTAIVAYNSGGNSGTYTLDSNTLTYTHGVTNSFVDDLAIELEISEDNAATNNLVEGAEDYTLTISAAGSTTGVEIELDETDTAVTTTITDGDTATWSLDGSGTVAEGASASYTLSLDSRMQAGEVARVDLAISFPAAGVSMDAASADDFVNELFTDVDTAIFAYNLGENSGMFSLDGSTLTYTHGSSDGTVNALEIDLGTVGEDAATNDLIEGPEDFTLTISDATAPSTTGATVAVDGMSDAVTTTVTDGDSATWSIVGSNGVTEGENATYTVSLDGVFAEGEVATINIGLTGVDTTNTDYANFLTAVGAAATAYAGNGAVVFDGTNKLSFTASADGETMDNVVINLGVSDDSLVEGVEDFTVSIGAAGSTTGATVVMDGMGNSVTTTITDNDTATWSLTDDNTVANTVGESATATFLLNLSGEMQAGETASVDLAISFPAAATSMDAAEDADFNNTFLSDVASAIDAYNMGENTGTFVLVDNTLTYTHGASDGAVDSLAINLDTGTDSMVEGPEDFTQTLTASTSPSTTGADIQVSTEAFTTTTAITDAESATWSLTDNNTVPNLIAEADDAFFLLNLGGFLQAGETASTDLAISFPATGDSLDAGDADDFVNSVLADVAAAVADYNSGENSGTFALVNSTLTYTHGPADGIVDTMSFSLTTEDDELVEGPEDFTLTIADSTESSTTGANILVSESEYTTNTTITDDDVATWSLVDDNETTNEVDEGATASYLLKLAGSLEAGETATVDLAISYLAAGISQDEAETVDFTNTLLADVAIAITAYNGGENSGTYSLAGSTLTYTHGPTNGSVDDFQIELGISNDGVDTNNLVEGNEDFALTISSAGSTSGAKIEVSETEYTTTTTINDLDSATWSLTDNTTGEVGENETSSFSLNLDGRLQAGETASVDLAISFPEVGVSLDAAEGADFVEPFLTAVAAAADAYNLGGNSGTFVLVDSTLTYTQSATDSAVDSLEILLETNSDSMVEGPEDFTQTLTESTVSSTTGATIKVSEEEYTTTTTITDADSATWTLADSNYIADEVHEGSTAHYLLTLGGFLQAGETASVDLAISFPNDGDSLDAAEETDFINAFLEDVDAAIALYNGGGEGFGGSAGTFDRFGNTLTYTQGIDDGSPASLQIDMIISEGVGFVSNLVEGPEDFSLTLTAATEPSSTGAEILVSESEFSTTTTIVDSDVATWTLADNNTVANQVDEAATASYLLSLDGTLQAGETATVDLAISFPNDGSSLDAAEEADFTNGLLADVATAIATYNLDENSGAYSLSGSTLTYTHGASDGLVDDLQLDLGISDDDAAADDLVEGGEEFALTISTATSTTGAEIDVDAIEYTTTTTIIDTDVATWSFTDNNTLANTVAEGALASYKLSLAGTLQAGETAMVDLAISFPEAASSMDAAETADFTNALVTDVDSAIAAYNGGGNSGTFTRLNNTLTYTHGGSDGEINDLQIDLGVNEDNAATNNLVEGGEDFALTISTGTSTTGAAVEVSETADTTTTTITDNDSATWSILDFNTLEDEINEGETASYLLRLDGFFQAGETASTQLSISFPVSGTDGSEADFVDTMLDDVDVAIAGYNSGGNNGTFTRSDSTLTYTHGLTDGTANDMQIDLASDNDALVESFEEFSLTVSAAGSTSGANIAIDESDDTVTTTINDNDDTDWSLTQVESAINEGDSAVYTLALSGLIQEDETATVDFSWTLLTVTSLPDFSETLSEAIASSVNDYNAAANDGDTLAWDGTTLTYTGGDDASGGTTMAPLIIDLDTFDDFETGKLDHLANLVEPEEDFDVTILNHGGSVISQFSTTDPVTLRKTIQDDDSAVVTITNIQVGGENPAGFGTDGLFEFSLSNPSQSSTFVNFTDGGFSAGTAEPGFDYVGILSAGLNFSAGETSKILSVDPVDDQSVEGPETVTIRLTGFTTGDPQITIASSPDNQATTEITDNDNTDLTVGDAVINEAEGTATISVTLGKAVQGGFTVPYTLGDVADTATGGIDYDNTGGSLVFAGTVGEVQMITIPISNEDGVESDEFITAKLGTAVPNTLTLPDTLINSSDTGQVTIRNDDIDVDLEDATVASQDEGNAGTTDYTFDVTRSGLNSGNTTVDWVVTGSGSNPAVADDFGGEFPSGTVTFAPGETTQTITISVSADSAVEAGEDFTVSISNPNDDDVDTDTVQINNSSSDATIGNDDSATLTVEDVSYNEATGLATVTVSVDHAVQGGFTVAYSTSDGSASAGSDYVAASDSLTFAGDAEEEHTFDITINPDDSVETNETINVALGTVSGTTVASIADDISAEDTAVVTIRNDDIDVDLGDATVASQDEGNAGTTEYTFEVTRTGLTSGTSTAAWAVTGSGENPADAADFGGILPSGIVSFAPGETSQTISINVSGDLTVEADENLTVTLSDPADTDANTDTVQINNASNFATIQNSDTATLTIENVSINEADVTGFATVTVLVDNAVQGGFTVDFATTGNSATVGSDFVGISDSLTFDGTAGQSKTFAVNIITDEVVEFDETIGITLSNVISTEAPASQIDETATALVTIEDNDTADLTVADVLINEAAGTAIVTVSVNNAVQGGFSVDLAINGDSASGGDFTGNGDTLTFNGTVGESRTFEVDITNDAIVEIDETINATLSNVAAEDAPATSIDSNDTAVVTIEDNDTAILTVADIEFVENSSVAIVTVTLDNAVDGGFNVDFATLDGTATSGDDYAAASGTLEFAGTAGETKTFEVSVNEDITIEPNETLSIVLSNIVANTVDAADLDATDTAIVTIIDDELQSQVGESGSAIGVTSDWTTINLTLSYDNPVVIAGPATYAGVNPAVVRVRNVTSNSFEIRIDEWDYLDGSHGPETVDYLVLEAGTHRLSDGSVITAGNQNVTSSWSRVPTGSDGTVLLTTVITDNDSATAIPRINNVGTSFLVKLQEEEGADRVHGSETISWIQFGEGSGTLSGTQFVTGQAPVTHAQTAITFEDSFASPPVFLAGVQTLNGGDPISVRRISVDGTEAVVFLEEETSLDPEIFHTAESVGFLAMDAGIIQAVAANDGKLGETGVADLNHVWTYVNFSQPYADPVVVLGTASTIGEQPVTTRVRNVTSTGFEARIQEWSYLDGGHVAESVAYMVMEAGVHVLEDGTTVTAGKLPAVTQSFQRIKFPIIFDSAPVVFSQVNTDNDTAPIVTRQGNVSATSVDLRLQEEETGFEHGAEVVSWIAFEQTTGVNNSLLFETGTTGNAVTQENFDLSFAQTYSSTPAFFAQLQSYNGGDPVSVRYRQLGLDGSQVFLQEERSADDELGHGAESVGYLAFEIGSIFAKNRAPLGRIAPSDIGNIPAEKLLSAQVDMRFVSVMPEASAYALTNSGSANRPSLESTEAFKLAGSIELTDNQADAAFAELAENDIAFDADFFDSFNEVFEPEA